MPTSPSGLRSRLRRACAATAVGAVLAFVGPGVASAAAGDLDPGFGGGDGIVVTDLPYYEDSRDMVLQPDGKILTVGTLTPAEGPGSDISLLRYTADGTPDASFGTGGAVTADLSDNDEGYAVALQASGRILVAGYSVAEENGVTWAQLTVLGFTANGAPDPTFGVNGRAFPDVGRGSIGQALRVLDDGRILVGGSFGSEFLLTRLLPDGALDTAFGGGDGQVRTAFPAGGASVQDLAVHSDGRIVAVGQSGYLSPTYATEAALARYLPDGTPDASFDGDGRAEVDWGGAYDTAHGVVLQSDGRIVVAGQSPEGFTVARFTTGGAADTSFGGDGRVGTTFVAGLGAAHDVALQPDGKIVATGVGGGAPSENDFAVARYLADGSLDSSFSGDGKVTTDVGFDFANDWEEGRSLVLQPDGKIVVSGVTDDFTARAVLRYDGTGAPAPTPPDADLSVTKSGPATVNIGDTVTYTLRVTNNSATTTATDVRLTDTFTGTATSTVLSATSTRGTCTLSPAPVSCAIGTLQPSATAVVTVVVEPRRTGSLTDTARVDATEDDRNASNDTATMTTTVNNGRGCTIIGTSGNDTLNGGYYTDVICALSGNDTVNASFGNDTVHAGPGNDNINGSYGNDTLIGGPGSDTLTGSYDSDTLNTVDGVSGNDTANGGSHTDTCTTDSGDTRISCP
ncbi:calcium-binding protein [Streptomyces sp. NPDC046712]|uniref:calcium-binding protein n=1 Tax=Streptomyces sp. NPDC046712 TaxID=3154802 RepID=UPI0033E742F7